MIRSTSSDGAKVSISKENAKENLKKLKKQCFGEKRSKGFIASLSIALGMPEGQHKQSFYFEFMDSSGNSYTLRISNHNVNSDNIGKDEKEISIVIKSRRQPNNFIAGNTNIKEFVYFKESIANGDGMTPACIVQDIITMLDTGVFADSSGIAVINTSTSSQQQSTTPSGNRLVTDERYEELKQRMRRKLGGQMNIGIDPEILAIGTEMAVYHLEKGA